uniref:Putative secreted protein n=1 Tax=Ixodes ricinus TaxID=34613 RepID=A0A6B0UGE6_IXORI
MSASTQSAMLLSGMLCCVSRLYGTYGAASRPLSSASTSSRFRTFLRRSASVCRISSSSIWVRPASAPMFQWPAGSPDSISARSNPGGTT